MDTARREVPEGLGRRLVSGEEASLTFADLIASAIVFLVWMPREAVRAGLRWWPFAVATLGGLCFAFPLFLYFRERSRMEGAARPQPA